MSRYHAASAILDSRTSARKVRPISGIDDTARGGLLKSGGKKKGPRKPRKGPQKNRWDWNKFIGLKEKDPEERLQRQIRRYKRDKRGRFVK